MRAPLLVLAMAALVAVGDAEVLAKKGAKGGDKPKAPAGPEISPAQLARYGQGARQVAAGDYAAAQQTLAPLEPLPWKSRDQLLYLLATAEASALPPDREHALTHFRALAGIADSRYRAVARARVADLLFESGKLAEARAAYNEVLTSPAPEVEPAVAHFRLGVIAAQQGQKAEALPQLRKVYLEHPSHPLAERALSRLRSDGGEAAATIRAEERIERARRLVNGHAWDRAIAELSAIPVEGLAAAVKDEIDFQLGMTHFKMRHGYDIAAQKLLGVWERLPGARQPEALFHGARAWSRADQDDRAIAGYKLVVEKFPGSKQAKEAHFLIGWLDFNRARYADGLPTLDKVARGERSSFSDDAAWFAAFSRWMLDDPGGALEGFEEYDRQASGALGDGKARYWKGRSLEKLGRKPEAIAMWKGVVDAFPFSYYAQQSRVRLARAGDKLGPFGTRVPSAPASPLAALGGEPQKTVAADARLGRVDELLAAGLGVEAAAELDRIDNALLKQYGGPRSLPVLFDRYLRAEDFFHVHRLAEANSGGALRRDPHTDRAARRWWELVYPLAYRRFVEKYGPTGSNPTYYLYTIMQKESAYNPHDISYADAIGLLQMIPPTSRKVGVQIGCLYTDDVLYDPEGNIQYGAWYIGHLLLKFKGQVALGAGAFNAGPKAMMRWIKQNGARPLDEFIELCPYTQTREYMKKALEIYARYLWLYDGRDYLPEQTIDTAWLDDGIDY